MRADLQKAVSGKWMGFVFGLGMYPYIEKTLSKHENVLYATRAKVSTGTMNGQQMVVYDFNQNIPGVLIVTTQAVWHFSKRDTGLMFEIMSLDDTSIDIKKSMFSSYIRLRSSGISGMDIIGLSGAEITTISKLISASIESQKELLEQKKKRPKSKEEKQR